LRQERSGWRKENRCQHTVVAGIDPSTRALGFWPSPATSTATSTRPYGDQALKFNTSGSSNVALGNSAGNNVITANNVICIHHPGEDVSNTTWISEVYGATTGSATTLPVIVSNTGQLGTMACSRRFKKEINAMDKTSEAILALKPVTFHYKRDNTSTPQFGLIAEEVAEVNPNLVVRDANGEIYSVRYDAVNAMLLNEFLKEHRKVEKLEAAVAELGTSAKSKRPCANG
jgi:Chaperone of endosialidase